MHFAKGLLFRLDCPVAKTHLIQVCLSPLES
nr:MAG TPA: hypothetical protein [Bacteriophage sp.]